MVARPPPRTPGAVPAAVPPVTVMSDDERDAAEDRSIGQTGQQPCGQLVGADVVEHRAGDDGGNEGAGSDGAAELLDHHDELGEPEARAALVLGQVESEPAQLGQVGPEGGRASSFASSRARAAPRASRLARKSEAVCPRARWSSVRAIGMAK